MKGPAGQMMKFSDAPEKKKKGQQPPFMVADCSHGRAITWSLR
jgi:hypothetical protein